MKLKTDGIVFKYFKYSDTSIVVKIFTRELGLQSFMVNSVRSAKAKNKIALFQPLTLLELVIYHKENANMQRIQEVKCKTPYSTLTTDIKKSTISLFLGEVLYKGVKEEGHVQELYDFIERSLLYFDHLDHHYENFHLQFLVKLSKFLGFGIINSAANSDEDSALIRQLEISDYSSSPALKNKERAFLLGEILQFYKANVPSLGDIRSISILKEILH